MSSNGLFVIVVRTNLVTYVSIYKPPSVNWLPNTMPSFFKPCINAGDFYIKHIDWGYNQNDDDGEFILNWMNNNGNLVLDAKDLKTFHSNGWNTEINPDLCFISECLSRQNILKRKVFPKFSRSQHRLVVYDVNKSLHLVHSDQMPRWNFRDFDWLFK